MHRTCYYENNDISLTHAESMDNTYAVMHNPRSQGNRKSGDQEELPPLPSKLYYVNIFDDPTAVEHKHDSATKKEGANEEELPPPLPPKMYENIFDDPGIAAEHTVGGDTAAGNTGSEQEEVPPPLPPKLYVNVFDDPAGSAKHGGGGHDVERGIAAAALTNGATGQESKAELQGLNSTKTVA